MGETKQNESEFERFSLQLMLFLITIILRIICFRDLLRTVFFIEPVNVEAN